jgi:hypothetical protein
MAWIWVANEVGKNPYQWSVNVGSRFRFPEISTLVLISIILSRPSNDSPDQRVRVWARRIIVRCAVFARHALGVALDGRQR